MASVAPAKDATWAWWQAVLEWLTGAPLQIVLIILTALIAQFALRWVIRHAVRQTSIRAQRERLENLRKIARTADLSQVLLTQRTEQRASAIGSLLSSVVSISVWAVAAMTILPLLGVDIAPLLASAGVIGVALGFGAQTLVKDYLSGIFMIIEDQIGVGDVVDLGPAIGTVEEVALRYTRLRDLSGVVWYVRNGEILRVGNRSQGWTLAIVDIPVDYRSDLDRVRDLIEAVAHDMDEDPAYDDMLLGKPTFAGVESMSGNAVIVRVTAKAVPEKQVPLAREIRERIKLAFDRAGIVIPMLPPALMPPAEPRTP
ncbi:MAG: mechanosensitive ion channel family protein [Actinomycetales bacterium]|nr:mechanosensitive ion channel family protein [Actinomycetales bacterium]